MWEASDDLSAMNNSIFSLPRGSSPPYQQPQPRCKAAAGALGKHWLLRVARMCLGFLDAGPWRALPLPLGHVPFGRGPIQCRLLWEAVSHSLSGFPQDTTHQDASPSLRGSLCPFLGSSPRVAYEPLQDRTVCRLLLSGAQYSAQHSECALDMFAE